MPGPDTRESDFSEHISPEAGDHLPVSGLVLETQRLLLRLPALTDAAAIAELADNPRIAHNLLGMPHPYRLEDARIWIGEPIEPGGQKYVICLKSSDAAPRLIGAITVDYRRGSALPTLGAWLGEAWWGRDYAPEAAHAVVDFAFLHQKHERLSFTCRVTNDAGRRVIEKCGFQIAAQELGYSRCHNAVVPVNRFTLERRIWESLRRWEPLRMVPGALQG
jgi:RimJ/RimL family protein N-acetyltransferase